ncbi:DUF2846 domain-containing protein [Sphingobium sp. WTD-1]|uniref:DUF2846 domain-containing protein n=1 Tax=Sphingobium sp. WTD-1 TaxID=2979467 RepID=UPI0024DE3A9D|nr:DUF2846 domain-containing protein [Sphingobium sp. WTD-1]WIA57831.1 DUF2846 domain-containing protein [Sphingobium sp. WTD-1]
MIIAIMLLAAQAGEVPASSGATGAPPERAKIVMYRGGSMMGMALGCPIRFHEREIVELGRGKFAEWEVSPGSYILTNKTSSVEVNVAAGQTKYVRCMIKTGFMTGRADLQIVDAESFAKNAAEFEKKEIAAPLEQ